MSSLLANSEFILFSDIHVFVMPCKIVFLHYSLYQITRTWNSVILCAIRTIFGFVMITFYINISPTRICWKNGIHPLIWTSFLHFIVCFDEIVHGRWSLAPDDKIINQKNQCTTNTISVIYWYWPIYWYRPIYRFCWYGKWIIRIVIGSYKISISVGTQ